MTNPESYFPAVQTFIILIFILFAIRAYRKKMELLEKMARKRNGTVGRTSAGMGIKFSYNGREVGVASFAGSRNSPPMTVFEAALPRDLPFKVNVYRESALTKVGKAFGLKDVQTFQQTFDEIFLVQASDENMARRVLTGDIQQKLLMQKDSYPELKLEKNKFYLKLGKYFRDEVEYDQFIDFSLPLLDEINRIG